MRVVVEAGLITTDYTTAKTAHRRAMALQNGPDTRRPVSSMSRPERCTFFVYRCLGRIRSAREAMRALLEPRLGRRILTESLKNNLDLLCATKEKLLAFNGNSHHSDTAWLSSPLMRFGPRLQVSVQRCSKEVPQQNSIFAAG